MWPLHRKATCLVRWHDSIAHVAHFPIECTEVIGNLLRLEDMVAILPICEIVVRQIRARHNDLVVDSIQLHVLQSPPFIDPLRENGLASSSEVGRMIHADIHPVSTEVLH